MPFNTIQDYDRQRISSAFKNSFGHSKAVIRAWNSALKLYSAVLDQTISSETLHPHHSSPFLQVSLQFLLNFSSLSYPPVYSPVDQRTLRQENRLFSKASLVKRADHLEGAASDTLVIRHFCKSRPPSHFSNTPHFKIRTDFQPLFKLLHDSIRPAWPIVRPVRHHSSHTSDTHSSQTDRYHQH